MKLSVYLRNINGFRWFFVRLYYLWDCLKRKKHFKRYKNTEISTSNLSFFTEDVLKILKKNNFKQRPPKSLVFEPTFKCNLKCEKCFQNIMRKQNWDKDIPTEKILKIIDNIDLPIEVVFLTGAEIFMREDVFQILKKFEEKKITCTIITNGTLITKDLIKKLKTLKNIGFIWISLDGLEERHNARRGGGFTKTVDTIKNLKRYFPVAINTVVSDDNLNELIDLIRFSKSIGIKKMLFEMEMYNTNVELRESVELGNLRYDELTVNLRDETRGFSYDEFVKKWKIVENEAWKNRIVPILIPSLIKRRDFFDGKIRDNKKLLCIQMCNARIDPQGNLVNCIFIRKSFGNLLEHKLSELWNNKECRKFRKMMVENNMLPVCKRCEKLRYIKD